jgi:hypothetical protein
LRRRHGRSNDRRSTLHIAAAAEIAAPLPVATPAAERRTIAPVGPLEAWLCLGLWLLLLNLRLLELLWPLNLLELRARFRRAHFGLRAVLTHGAVLARPALPSVAVILRKRSRRDQRRSRQDRGEQRFAHRNVLILRPDAMSGR